MIRSNLVSMRLRRRTFFAPFSFRTTSSLDALARVAARVDEVDDVDRAVAAALAVGTGGDGQVPLHVRQERLVLAELGGLLRIADRDERLEGRLQAEQIVLVGLVGADRDLDPRVEVHPVLVALAVLVGSEGRSARAQELRERLVRRQAGGLHELRGGGLQPLGVGLPVRDGLEPIAVAHDHGGQALERFLARRVSRDVRLEGLGRQVFGVEAGSLGARDVRGERREAVLPVPGPAHQVEVREGVLAARRGVGGQLLAKLGVASKHLAVEDRVHQARSCD